MNWNRRTFLTAAAGLGTRVAGAPPLTAATTSQAGTVGREMHRCLFLDDVHIDRLQNLKRRAHPARRYQGNPLFTKKFPWGKARLQLYGHCIVYNGEQKLYQMFYLAQRENTHYPNSRVGGKLKVGYATLPAYTESQDGVHWERPLRWERLVRKHGPDEPA